MPIQGVDINKKHVDLSQEFLRPGLTRPAEPKKRSL